MGCLLIAIPLSAFIIKSTAESLNVPPAGLILAVAVLALVARSSSNSAQPHSSSATQGPQHGSTQRGPSPRRSSYEQIREIVDRYEAGEISEGRRDALLRELRR